MTQYLGDFVEDDVVYIMFNTFTSDDPSASSTITNFANTDVHIHKDDDLTQRNNAAGITVSIDFDGITGSHLIKIDTNDNTVAGFWVTGKDYFVRIEGTTVDAATINATVAHFSIQNRYTRGTDSAYTGTPPTVGAIADQVWDELLAGHTGATTFGGKNQKVVPSETIADYKATGFSTHAAADIWSVASRILTANTNLNDPTAAVNAAAVWDKLIADHTGAGSFGLKNQKVVPSETIADYKATGFSTHSAADIWSVATRALTDKSGFALLSTGANLILKDSAFALAMADAIWDEILTGATHNIATSAGRRVREIGAYAIESGTAQAGDSHSITLAATADAVDGMYNRNLIILTDNTGVGQTRTIVDYNGTTKVAIIDRDWRTTPDATTEYQVTPDNTALVVDQGVAQAGTATTITLRDYASSINDTYLCNVIAIIAGTGRGQARLVGSYVGATKVVTICGDNWVTTPDSTSVYVLMPYGTTCTSCIGTHALGLIKSEADDALTDIKLDHLIAVADGDDPVNDSIIAQIAASDGDWSGFAKADDALEAIRDRGDSAWATATSVTVSDKTGFALSSAGVDAIFDENVEGTHTFREMMRLFASMLVGKVSGGGTTTIVFRDIDDSKNRIVMTVTEVGNRTDLILTED